MATPAPPGQQTPGAADVVSKREDQVVSPVTPKLSVSDPASFAAAPTTEATKNAKTTTPAQAAATAPDAKPVAASNKRPSKRSGKHKHKSSKISTVLTTMQKKQVDAVFESLFGYAWGTRPEIAAEHRNDSRFVMLQNIFGSPTAAAQILHRHGQQQQTKLVPSTRTADNAAQSSRTQPAVSASGEAQASAPSVPSAASHPSTAPQHQPASTSAEDAPETTSAEAAGGGGGGAGVDALLQQMQGKKGTSTIMKTAMDWEQFKEDQGTVGERLEQHAESKGAYLKRQDFLTRVDHRQFEQERQERERNRAKNG